MKFKPQLDRPILNVPTTAPTSFDIFFKAAIGNAPCDYQSRLSGGDASRPCKSRLISIFTSFGKTAVVSLAWLCPLRLAYWKRPRAANERVSAKNRRILFP